MTVSLLVVLWLCMGAVFAGLAYVRCVDAAREAALGVARGDSTAVDRARVLAPGGAEVAVHSLEGNQVRARVTSRVPVFPLLLLEAESVTAVEAGYE